MNILFTCAGRRVALLDAFRSAMAELDVQGRIYATDITISSPAFHKADEGLLVPRVEDVAYVGVLLNAVRRHRIGLLVPLTDLDLPVLSRRREEFLAVGCEVMIGARDVVEACQDKKRTAELVACSGLRAIRTVPLKEFLSAPFYPCFVKPNRGSAGVGAEVIRDDRELKAHIGTFGWDLIAQEHIGGQEYTIDVYRTKDAQVRCVVPRQRLVVRTGEVEKGLTVKNPALTDAAVRLAGVLGDLWGVFCCQCRTGPDGVPRFFEINPRFGGGAPLSIAAGANLPLYLLQEVLHLPVTARVGDFTENLLMMRYDQAVFVQVDEDMKKSLPGLQTPWFR